MSTTERCPHCGKLNHDLEPGANMCLRCGKEFTPAAKQAMKHRPLRESDIEKYLVKMAKGLGGEVRKVQWIGRRGAPDRVIFLDPQRAITRLADAVGCSDRMARLLLEELLGMVLIWPELKAPGVAPEPHQLREHERMRKMGQRVEVIDSYARVDEVLS